jgi:hypothetical protein
MRSIVTALDISKGRKLLALVGLAAALMAVTAAPAKADGINLIITPPGWSLYSKSCSTSTFVANGRWESFCQEFWNGPGYPQPLVKQQWVGLYWDSYTRCWRQYKLYIHYGLPGNGDPWYGPSALPTYCYPTG